MEYPESWPTPNRAKLPLLENRPPLDHNGGLHPEDRNWKEHLVRQYLSGNKKLPDISDTPESGLVRGRIDRATHRLYHLARLLQTRFNNPNHGNYSSPLLETLFILLTWRSRIETAHQVLGEIVQTFPGPRHACDDSNFQLLQEIVSVAGFSEKRPRMVADLLKGFLETFDGDPGRAMENWNDQQLIDFLTSLDGIGYKSALCVLAYSLERDRFPADAHVRRILRRTGILDELYSPGEEIGHRKFQAEVEVFIPPSVRRVLHAGLVALGRDQCKARSASCASCPASQLCDNGRRTELLAAEGRPLTHVDLFCGAGGFGTGFSDAGFRTVIAADHDTDAVRTFQLNHPSVPPDNVREVDLESVSPRSLIDSADLLPNETDSEDIHVITAGIPCQGFSKAGYRARPDSEYNVDEDPRNQLFRVLLDWTDALQPSYVVIENVPEMKNAGEKHSGILNRIEDGFTDLGYSVSWAIVDCSDLGVPQVRRRLIVIASRADREPVSLDNLGQFHEEGSNTLLEAIGDLPPVEADAGRWYRNVGGSAVTGHVARYNNEEDLRIFGTIRPGEHYGDFVDRRPDIIEERRENSERAVYSTDSFGDKYHKLEPDQPSRTIVAHLSRDGNGYIHPEQIRSLTPREAARLQGFPDHFVFCGSRSSQFIQIGNAVPPRLAKRIAQLLRRSLANESNE